MKIDKKKIIALLFGISVTATLFANPPEKVNVTVKPDYLAKCGDTSLSLGMTKQAVLTACGQPTTEYKGHYNSAEVLKLKYINANKAGSALILRFSDMQHKDKLTLYKIELKQWNDQYSPY